MVNKSCEEALGNGGSSYSAHPYANIIDTVRGYDLLVHEAGRFTPEVNVAETKNAYCIEIIFPGMKREEINIDVKDGLLIVYFRQEKEEIEQTFSYMRSQFSYNSFDRFFKLPENVKSNKMEVLYSQDTLKIILPKV